jgi:hypothetical protein
VIGQYRVATRLWANLSYGLCLCIGMHAKQHGMTHNSTPAGLQLDRLHTCTLQVMWSKLHAQTAEMSTLEGIFQVSGAWDRDQESYK